MSNSCLRTNLHTLSSLNIISIRFPQRFSGSSEPVLSEWVIEESDTESLLNCIYLTVLIVFKFLISFSKQGSYLY